jgi:putative ABC transport system permease protein
VKAISPGLIDMIDYSTDDGVINLIIQGWRADTFMFPAMEFIDGGPFKTDDEKSAVLGAGRAKALGLKVGDTIMIQREAFKVVGIWQGYGLFDNNTVTVPLKQLQELMVRDNAVTGFSIRIDREAEGFTSVEDLCNQIDAIEDSDGRHMRMDAMTTEELAQNAMYLKMSSAMAWVTTAIAIAMGIFGMLNTMLMSVVERVREISILRALGWRRRSIVQMIMGESIIMCLAGGILGALLAVLGIRLLTRLPAVSGFIRPDIAPVVVLTGIGLAIVVAFVGGVYPAYRATRLRPAEGMSHE